jgi:predicted AlkP superfamily phosphohydrolase/phosphomutase
MPKHNPFLIIGLDGATWDVLDPWMRDGSLPHLARLRQSGSWGVLRSSLPPITAPAWSSFMTGKRPGKHGMFHFYNLFDQSSSNNEHLEIVDARGLKSPTLWDLMGHDDRRLILVNVPMTYPPRAVNGIMITGLLTPRNAPVFTYPPELSREISDYTIDLERFIDNKPFQANQDPDAIAPNLDLMDDFRDMLEKRARTSLSLMHTYPWDVFMVVFTGTDRMGHYLWPYHRQPDPDDAVEIQQLCRAVHAYYRRLDEIVGELVQSAGENVTAVVMSDHGMGLRFTKRLHLNNWLHQHGWLAGKSQGSRVTNADAWLRRLQIPRDKVGRILNRIPHLMKSKLAKRAAQSRSALIDVEKSSAYCLPMYNNFVGIRITSTGMGKEALKRSIMERLLEIQDPETGDQVVRQALPGETYFYGPYAENTPDIVAILNPDYGLGAHLSEYSSVVTKIAGAQASGGHRLEGIFIATGPRIASNPEPLPGLNIEDIAPTLLHLMDFPVPSDMDGRVLTETLSPNLLERQPVRYGEPMRYWPEADKADFGSEIISDSDAEEIRERLRALGYLE